MVTEKGDTRLIPIPKDAEIILVEESKSEAIIGNEIQEPVVLKVDAQAKEP